MNNKLNSNFGLISEKEINDLALEKYKQNIKEMQEKEKALSKMPYSEEYPRLAPSKHNTCHEVIIRSLWLSLFFTAVMAPSVSKVLYRSSYSRIRGFKTYPFCFISIFTFRMVFYDLGNPLCQTPNRGDMSNSTYEEEVFRYLIEKCNMYDHIDAILDLKDKYSLYELEQLQKEWKMKNAQITVENAEKFRDKRRGLI